MNSVYCAILDKRASFILNTLHWTDHLKECLLTNFLSAKELKSIERCDDSQERLRRLLDKISRRHEPNVFLDFCNVIEKSGYHQVAETLLDDCKRIKWDFKSLKQQVTSFADYMDFIEDQFLKRLASEQDTCARAALLAELSKRLKRLASFSREQVKRQQKLRHDILVATQSNVQLLQPDVQMTPGEKRTFATLALEDSALDNTVLQEFKSYISKIELEKKAVELKCETYRKQAESVRNDYVKTKFSHSRQHDKMLILENVIHHQDKTLTRIHAEQEHHDEGIVRLPTDAYERLLGLLNSRAPEWNIEMPKADDFCDKVTHLKDIVQCYINGSSSTMECFQQRVKDMSQRIVELENQRALIADFLKVSNVDDQLDVTIKQRFGEMDRNRQSMESDLRKQQERVHELEEKNRALQKELELLKTKVKSQIAQTKESQPKFIKSTPRNVGFMAGASARVK